MAQIHPAAIVDPRAELADDVIIGPFCHVGPQARLGPRVELISHVVIGGITEIGAGTRIFPFASIGLEPQDLKYRGEPSRLEIGADNLIREGVSINTGTEGGGMVTRIGDRNLFMLGSHIGHDCQVGNGTVFANNATLAGHVTVGDFAFLGGLSAVHQFCRIGQSAMIGGVTGVEHDVIPYGMVTGDRARLDGLNLRGLQRRGFTAPEIQTLRQAYKILFGDEGTFAERVERTAERYADFKPMMEIIGFIRADSKRRIVQPGHGA
ncbi:MAG: UDP-N-acetylglucosamine acyltransferase [Aliidongia sp.]|jgi:UDP-N-acetylglucosamine acyltransferase|nr:UDP-N-acetylglucosamine acyltransferase [Aliidongia sp.]